MFQRLLTLMLPQKHCDLNDTPVSGAMGLWVSRDDEIGCTTPSLYLRFCPLELRSEPSSSRCRSLWAESQKSLKKGLFRGLQKRPRRYPRKSKKASTSGSFSAFWGVFGDFVDPPKKTAILGAETPAKWRLGS